MPEKEHGHFGGFLFVSNRLVFRIKRLCIVRRQLQANRFSGEMTRLSKVYLCKSASFVLMRLKTKTVHQCDNHCAYLVVAKFIVIENFTKCDISSC